MSKFRSYIVSFVEQTHYTTQVEADSNDHAVDQVKSMCETLSSSEKADAFTRVASGYDIFNATPEFKTFRVRVGARAIYDIELEATDKEDAERFAEDKWNAYGLESFDFVDFMDLHCDAEEVDP